jgi:hypothetical protein
MTTNRRHFVGSLVGVPLLLGSAPASLIATQPVSRDPVLDQILADLRELAAEAKARPEARKATLRALETSLGIQAAHVGTHYDPHLQNSLKRRLARVGRAAVVNDAVTFGHNTPDDGRHHGVSDDTVDAAVTQLAQRGYAGMLRDIQRTLRQVRLQAPDAVQAAATRTAQFDYCSDLRWQIQMLEAMMTLACSIAILEPTPFLEAGCAAMGIVLAVLLFQQMLWC